MTSFSSYTEKYSHFPGTDGAVDSHHGNETRHLLPWSILDISEGLHDGKKLRIGEVICAHEGP